MLPPFDDICDRVHVVCLPMTVTFRGITHREIALIDGPARWAEFSPFLEYPPSQAWRWLAAGLDAAYGTLPPLRRQSIPVNATVPAVDASQVPDILAHFPEARSVKVKVAQPGQTLADDLARVEATRALIPHVRVDANGGWTLAQAIEAERVLSTSGPLEYLEQPCRSTQELAALRRYITTPIAADESIRHGNPYQLRHSNAADIAVLKVAPLGGVNALIDLASQLNMPVVISSALDSVVGISLGLYAAGALPQLPYACGLATGSFFHVDVAPPIVGEHGLFPTQLVSPCRDRLEDLAVDSSRRHWWIKRIRECWELLQAHGGIPAYWSDHNFSSNPS